MRILKTTIIILSWTVLGISVFSLLPGWMLAEWMSSFRLQYAAIALLLLSVSIFVRHRHSLIVSIIALLLNLYFILPYYYGSAEQNIEGSRLTLYAANVQRLKADIDVVFEQIDRLQPDIVFLQEIDPDFEGKLRALLGGYEELYSEPRTDRFGIMLFGKFPLDTVVLDTFPLSMFKGGFIPFYRVRTSHYGSAILFLFAHLIPPMPSGNFRDRNAQLQKIETIAAGTDGNLIVAGDFNTSVYSPRFRKLLKEGGLQDARKGFGLLNSWPTWLWPLRTNLDHCLYKGNLVPVEMKLMEDVGSDHFPVYVTFKLIEK